MNQLQIAQQVSLTKYSTMHLGGQAQYAVGVTTPEEVAAAHTWAAERQLPVRMVGSGSNIVWRDEGFPGLLIVNTIKGFEVANEDDQSVMLTIGSGESWDEVVARSVTQGLTGIEALSLIPGTAGATPIQNVGAYGQDIAQTLVSVDTYDTQNKQFTTIPVADCALGYRTSRFKTIDSGRFLITSITLRLAKGNPQPPFYAGVQKYFDDHHITTYTPQIVRDAVIAIRTAKLPDPRTVANNGSFFANPIIDADAAIHFKASHPYAPTWPASDGRTKISAAWLIEQAGLKGYHDPETGMATWPIQPLVLVNEHATSTANLLAFKQKIVGTVQAKFGITLEQEPELLP